MQHFKIYDDGETYQEPVQHRLFVPGTHLTFNLIAGQLKASISIPVQFA